VGRLGHLCTSEIMFSGLQHTHTCVRTPSQHCRSHCITNSQKRGDEVPPVAFWLPVSHPTNTAVLSTLWIALNKLLLATVSRLHSYDASSLLQVVPLSEPVTCHVSYQTQGIGPEPLWSWSLDQSQHANDAFDTATQLQWKHVLQIAAISFTELSASTDTAALMACCNEPDRLQSCLNHVTSQID
jgi:hypothetical protein